MSKPPKRGKYKFKKIIMCSNCSSKEYCDYLKKGDTYNCLKKTMTSANNREWNKHIAEWNGWFQDL